MFLYQLDKATRIVTIHVAQTDNVPAACALLSSLSSQQWVRIGVNGFLNALKSLQAGFHVEGDHTVVPLLLDLTIGDACTDNTLDCSKIAWILVESVTMRPDVRTIRPKARDWESISRQSMVQPEPGPKALCNV